MALGVLLGWAYFGASAVTIGIWLSTACVASATIVAIIYRNRPFVRTLAAWFPVFCLYAAVGLYWHARYSRDHAQWDSAMSFLALFAEVPLGLLLATLGAFLLPWEFARRLREEKPRAPGRRAALPAVIYSASVIILAVTAMHASPLNPVGDALGTPLWLAIAGALISLTAVVLLIGTSVVGKRTCVLLPVAATVLGAAILWGDVVWSLVVQRNLNWGGPAGDPLAAAGYYLLVYACLVLPAALILTPSRRET
jgi:hypothetical protein